MEEWQKPQMNDIASTFQRIPGTMNQEKGMEAEKCFDALKRGLLGLGIWKRKDINLNIYLGILFKHEVLVFKTLISLKIFQKTKLNYH